MHDVELFHSMEKVVQRTGNILFWPGVWEGDPFHKSHTQMLAVLPAEGVDKFGVGCLVLE